MAIEENITIYPYIFNTYLKYVKINIDILDKLKFLFKEKHFFNCINIQGLSLNKSLFYCYSLKKANDIAKFELEASKIVVILSNKSIICCFSISLACSISSFSQFGFFISICSTNHSTAVFFILR